MRTGFRAGSGPMTVDDWAKGHQSGLSSHARPIETVEQAHEIVHGERATLLELMDCAELGKAVGDFQLRKDAAERALSVAIGGPRPIASVDMAAQHIAAATLGEATGLGDLGRYLSEIRLRLGRIIAEFPAAQKSSKLRELEESLSAVALLLTDPDPGAKLRLCSRLRKLERPDLGIKAAQSGIKVEPNHVPLLTTMASAQLDIGASTLALKTIERAVRLEPENVHALNVYSRALHDIGRLGESLNIAQRAFELDANVHVAQRILAVAAALKDADAFDHALEFVRRNPLDELGEGDMIVLLLAVETLLEANDLERADKLFKEFEQAKRGRKLAGQRAKDYSRLKKRLAKLQQPTLPSFDDGANPA